MSEVWQQRFQQIRQEQAEAQRAIEEKQAAYKAQVGERIKAVEVRAMTRNQTAIFCFLKRLHRAFQVKKHACTHVHALTTFGYKE